MADVNINAGNISSVNLRQQGSNPTAPANGIKLFEKASGIYFVDSNSVVSGPLGAMFTPGGRLSMQSGTAVTTTDMHSGTSLWYNPHIHDMLSLWDGSKIVPVQFAPTAISLAGLSGTSSFDVFTYLNSGVPAYETSMWTSPTVRAVDISMQNGRKCKVGDATRLYLGSFYTSSGGQTDDSATKRFVWNYYNRVDRKLYKTDSTGHTYNNATIRAWNNDAAQRVEYICGVVENTITLILHKVSISSNNAQYYSFVVAAPDVTDNLDVTYPILAASTGLLSIGYVESSAIAMPILGYHFISINELSTASATHTFSSYYFQGAILG